MLNHFTKYFNFILVLFDLNKKTMSIFASKPSDSYEPLLEIEMEKFSLL